MALVLTKGVMTNGSFSTTTASWFFWNPYWHKDNDRDFVIRVQNTGSSTEYLAGVNFTFQIADSNGQSFPNSSGTWQTAVGHNCTMAVSIEGSNGQQYTGTSNVIKDPNLVFHFSSNNGESYWTPRPGPTYQFKFYAPCPIAPGDTKYIYFEAAFWGQDYNSDGNQNCIQISSYDTVTAIPTHTVTWKLNGGQCWGSTADIVQTVAEGDSADKPADADLSKSGYVFAGWSPNNNSWQNVQTDLTYTAQWTQATVSCTFNRNQYANDNRVIKTKTVNVGTTLASAKPNPNPSWIGISPMTVAIFEGWSNTPTGTPMTSQQEQACQITADGTTFYARWRAPRVQFYRNFDDNDAALLGDGVASLGLSIGNNTAPRTQANAPDYNEDPNRISSDVLHYNPGEYIDLQGRALYRDVGPNIEQALLDLETSEYKFIFYGWRTDRTYHIINQDETVACVDLRNCTAQSDDSQNRYYAVWKRIRKAAIWVVETYDDNGTTRKRWVKKRNLHKVVLEGQTKSWVDVPPKIVTLNGSTKQWENDT